jgi:hypothetical protein
MQKRRWTRTFELKNYLETRHRRTTYTSGRCGGSIDGEHNIYTIIINVIIIIIIIVRW